MKIPDIPLADVRRAAAGDYAAVEDVLRAIQPGVFNLAVRMLADREDAADATQEILLKVVTHLGGFRGEAAFSTWVWRIARHHLLNAATRRAPVAHASLEQIAAKLERGLDHARSVGLDMDAEQIGPDDKADAVGVAIGCTQGMLMALDRDERMVYLLDVVFGLSSDQAAQVVGIAAPAFRKRLSRVRERMQGFLSKTCGLVDADAPCRCPRQLPALRALAQRGESSGTGLRPEPAELPSIGLARAHFDRWRSYGDAAAVFRGHPEYRAPGRLVDAIRTLLVRDGYLAE